ncbi:exonuclease domain-containing protein [Limosilactobacillus reuteri]|uniref:exonuclease domain-containing protein n=1 Tax=Limosilactobacillus reuteri TaxID=1598 RepID=UPI0026705E6E|nr:exonuclease domain-containing protein [Limosilactobacillus reuteri]MDY6195383.1 exonuclease domain-containing protein [Lactobacillus johnsonii]
MKHFWQKLRWFLLIAIIYFILGMLFSNTKSDLFWAVYALGLFIGFPIYLLWIVLSEIKYQIKNKRKSLTKAESSNTNPIKPFQDSINSGEGKITTNKGEDKQSSIKTDKHVSKISNINDDALPLSNESITTSQSVQQANSKKDYSSKKELDDLGIKVTFKPIAKTKTKEKTNITIHHLRRKLYNFVVVDTETTGLEKRAKIIQLSAVRYEHDKPVDSFNKYINPEIPLPSKITAITGISNEQLLDAPKFNEVVSDFMQFVGTLPWVGHNINRFDILRLVNNGLPITEVSTIDTLNLAKKKLHMDKYSLENLKHYYGIQNKSHNALEDCKTNAVVYQRLRDDILVPVQSDYSNVPQTLTGLNFAISGSFPGYSRKDVEELIKSHGGKTKSTVTHDTDYLIDGTQISDQLTDGIHSSKELKAKDYGTKIISLSEFKNLLGSN